MQLFYNPELGENDDFVLFSKDESKHIINVLRMKLNDPLQITNGNGFLFDGIIIDANPKACKLKIISSRKMDKNDYSLHLAVAPTKMNDRYEWFLEKATEIGIDSITPILCENSERKTIKADRYERIIQSAMKQSLQVYKPLLNELMSFKEFIKKRPEGQGFIAHCEDSTKYPLGTKIQKKGAITILIGPEGDFSSSEILTAKENGFIPVSLGNSRLRTETAAIIACSTVALVNELSVLK